MPPANGNVPQKSDSSIYPGFKLKLKVDDTDYYSKKLDQHFDSY